MPIPSRFRSEITSLNKAVQRRTMLFEETNGGRRLDLSVLESQGRSLLAQDANMAAQRQRFNAQQPKIDQVGGAPILNLEGNQIDTFAIDRALQERQVRDLQRQEAMGIRTFPEESQPGVDPKAARRRSPTGRLNQARRAPRLK